MSDDSDNQQTAVPKQQIVLLLTPDQLRAAGFVREKNTYNWRKSGLMFDEEHRTWWHWGWQVHPTSHGAMQNLVENPTDATGLNHQLSETFQEYQNRYYAETLRQ